MSLLQKSEVRLRLGLQHCTASLWLGRFRPAVVAVAEVHAVTKPIGAVLQALAAQGHDKPAAARVCVEDELLYYDLRPAAASQRVGEDAVQQELHELLGGEPLAVASRLTPCGTQRLLVGMPQSLLAGVQDELAEQGVRLLEVSAAMPDDLFAVRAVLPRSGVVVLLREEGMVLLSLYDGRVADVFWERCNLAMANLMIERINGYAYRFARHASDDMLVDTHPDVLLVVSHAAQRVKLGRLAKAHDWRVVSLEDQVAPAPKVAA